MKFPGALFFSRAGSLVLLAFFVVSCITKPGIDIDLTPQFELSNQYFEAGNSEKGYAVLNQIAAHYPTSPAAALGLGTAYFRWGAYDNAATFFRRADQLAPGIPAAKLGQEEVELARNDATEGKVLFSQYCAKIRTMPSSSWMSPSRQAYTTQMTPAIWLCYGF
ncbi:tetratricopeptide repeat protein [Brucella sp. IR073]|uniref:tetratricopeptide repeat protein n=1 Tax=unclassified Brucella TaxID=2632610 RepID=UPI003B982E97